MKTSQITGNQSEWLNAEDADNQIVLSSRIRLARNLRGFSYPGWTKKAERVEILDEIKPAVSKLDQMQDEVFSEELVDLTALEKQVLIERHLISREHAAKSKGSAVVVSENQSVSIMVNEEDHLRMQALLPGLQLDSAFDLIDSVDSQLEKVLNFAFHSKLGYLTACPTNLGTGMRASAMLHLPALVLNDQVNQVIQAVNKIGLAVRGLYGEGTEAMGNLFQISNQTTLGESERAILARLTKVINTVIQHEENARAVLTEKNPGMILDQVGRAYGVLQHAHSMASKEALNLLSFIRLGIDLKLLPEDARILIDELFMETQPAHLQKNSRKKLAAEKRDSLRAEIIRDKLKNLPKPDIGIFRSDIEKDESEAN